ncbi:MAG: TonB-dependent receptor [Woeseia sp.]|nr:TonB-dependent receptor [Woeseia sp.]
MINIFKHCLTIGAAIVLFVPLVHAQSIEEIVVTAQKRAESLQDVPIAMDAFSGDELGRVGVQSAEDVLRLMPNAGTLPQGGSKQNFFIRGVGTADFHLNVVGAVGAYLDDSALNSPFAISFSTFDMERVEVLRGPQNTLFGRNTTGGAVNYISRRPDPNAGTNGYIKAGIGRFSQFDIEGGLGFAVSETAAFRVSATSNTRDGVFKNMTLGQDVGETDRMAARAHFLWQPSDNWEVLVTARTGRSDGDPMPFKNVGTLDPNDLTQPCSVPLDSIIPQNNPNCADSTGFVHQYSEWEQVFGNVRHHEDVETSGGTLKIDWSPGPFSVTSITSVDNLDVEYIEDSDAAPTLAFNFHQNGAYEQWSQELRVTSDDDASVRWIGGAYYFSEDANFGTTVRRTPAPLAPSGTDFFNIIPNTIVNQENTALSLFGQAEFDVADDWTLTVGYRWTNEEKVGANMPSVRCAGPNGGPPFCPSLSDDTFLPSSLVATLPAVATLPTEVLNGDWNEWGARVSLDWQMSDEVLLYGSVSRGFKGGGFALAALQALLGNAARSVEPETLLAYEFGMKSDWRDGALRFNASVFAYDWENYQSFQPLVDPVSGIAVPLLLNVPETSLVGAEAELTWVPAESWYLQAGLGLLNGEIDDAGNIAGVSNGNDLVHTPDLTFTGLVRKEIQVGSNLLALQTNVRFQDDVTYDLGNAANLSQEGYWNVNARASYEFGSERKYEVSFWGENLTGEEYCVGMTSLAGLTESNICLPSLSEPTYGITAALNFD